MLGRRESSWEGDKKRQGAVHVPMRREIISNNQELHRWLGEAYPIVLIHSSVSRAAIKTLTSLKPDLFKARHINQADPGFTKPIVVEK